MPAVAISSIAMSQTSVNDVISMITHPVAVERGYVVSTEVYDYSFPR